MWIHKKRCTAETDGTVMNIQGKGSEGLTVITVEYEVKNQKYQIRSFLSFGEYILYAPAVLYFTVCLLS